MSAKKNELEKAPTGTQKYIRPPKFAFEGDALDLQSADGRGIDSEILNKIK